MAKLWTVWWHAREASLDLTRLESRLLEVFLRNPRQVLPKSLIIERVWRHLKDKLACHRWWADLDGLRAATGARLDRTEARFHRPAGITLRPVQNFRQVA